MQVNPAAALLGCLGLIGLIFLAPLIGISVGAFAGWVVGQFFPGTVGLVGSAITGGATIPAWQVGAILGFVGGFFKTNVSSSRD
jgi:hypothetical protein